MELQLVSFTQAKTLKKLGMPINIQKFCYAGDGNLYYIVNKDFYPAPTLELAAKWFREKKNLFIIISNYNTSFMTPDKEVGYMFMLNTTCPVKALYDSEKLYDTYEQALSAGIDKAIEILQKTQ